MVTASDGTNTSTRQYTITSTTILQVQLSGSGTFTVPTGISAEILIVGGGGSGARSSKYCKYDEWWVLLDRTSYSFTATDKSSGIAYSVGVGGGTGVGLQPLKLIMVEPIHKILLSQYF